MNDYIYVFDLKEDYYIISEHAMDRFLRHQISPYDATKKHKEFVYPHDIARLTEETVYQRRWKRIKNMKYRWLDRNHNPVWINQGYGLVHDNKEPHYLVLHQ